nr:MAG TPA: hypothetical protein [Bacteriophage sp.]
MTINNAISAITKDVLILIWQFIMSFLLFISFLCLAYNRNTEGVYCPSNTR